MSEYKCIYNRPLSEFNGLRTDVYEEELAGLSKIIGMNFAVAFKNGNLTAMKRKNNSSIQNAGFFSLDREHHIKRNMPSNH